MGRSVTMRTVAERAGVSAKTVSNVVNGTGSFSPETEHRVRAAIEELGYQVNPFARGLRSRRTGTIALALPNVHQPFNAELAEQVIRVSEAGGLKVVVEPTRGNAARERAALSTSHDELVDGVIYVPHALTPEEYLSLPVTRPTVVLGERPADAAGRSLDYVEIADEQGAHAAVTHLLAQGRRRIAAICERAEPRAGARRLRGYRRALAEAGMAYDDSLVIGVDNADLWSSGAGSVTRLLRTRVRFDALFCHNDVVAIGALSVLERSGVAVPDDVALAGFDDIEAARFTSPPVTTVDPQRESIARRAVALLRSRMDAEDFRELQGRCESAGFVLRVRESSSTAPHTLADPSAREGAQPG
ncbi:LacI family transcriptional regulator [Streptomyces ipomoeae]|uniref:Periplasmic binding protein and sugar binding domain of the LacI family protein n=3 Tax=Streptomyces ipomoeae TaxID=103232 RepID=L1KY77_9ACTN|nr:periplasmic binding protein and sugar binding domain of the LacI family protein [Streptomyces ipomoeae 91-03]TQE20921.1 LacI family transcriptional regulator [Streptomyces ipomoeae]TQE33286.1 LacI family transcriptional regulator [Streptomyces ipomoeae]